MKRYRVLSMLLFIGFQGVAVAQSSGAALTLNVEKCREMALAGSEDIKKGTNSLTQSGLDRKIAISAFLPAVEATGTGLYMAPDMEMSGMEMIMKGTYMAGVMLTQPIYAGGKILTGKKMAEAGESAAGEQLRAAKASVIYDADNAYWTYVAVLQKQEMMNVLAAQLDTLFSQIGVASSAGMATGADLLTVKAKRSEVEYQVRKVANGVALCKMALCRVVGVPFDTEIAVEDVAVPEEFTRIETGNVSVADRPEMKLLETGLEVSRLKVRMTRGDYLPTLALVGGYCAFGNMKMKTMVDSGGGNYVPYTQKIGQDMGVAMVSLNIPIFKWGQGYNKVRKAKLDVDNAALDLQKNSRLLELQANQAAFNLSDSYNLIAAAKDGKAQADENLRVTENRYHASMCPLSDYLDAQFQWQQARSNLIEAFTQSRIAETDYLMATGALVR